MTVLTKIRLSTQAKQLPMLEKLAKDIVDHPTVLEEHLPLIKAKSLVLWGKNDRVLDVSSLDVLGERLAAKKEVVVMDECGHLLQHEKYQECTCALNRFIFAALQEDDKHHQAISVEHVQPQLTA